MKDFLKEASINFGIYGHIKRMQRRFVHRDAYRRFNREREFYAPFIAAGSLCFDVGGNVGNKAEVFLSLGARVISFEPQPDAILELEGRCAPFASKLTAINAAVGSAKGTLPLYVGKHSTSTSLIAGWNQDVKDVFNVPVTTLDDEIARFGVPYFCKIDVEGFELEVLKGLTHRIPCITLEYHHDENNVRQTLDCVDYLARLGSVSMNVTFGDETGFCWNEWISHQQFRDWFPAKAPRTEKCGWGDVFIRIAD